MDAQPPIMRTAAQEAGMLSGRSFLTDPGPMAHAVAAAVAAMSKLSDEITRHRSDHWNATNPFSRTFRSIREGIGQVDAAARRLDEARRFSGQANVARIALWSRFECEAPGARVRHAVEAEGRTLINPESGARWSVPATLALPALAKLDDLRRVLGE
jgi:hypothetical protein